MTRKILKFQDDTLLLIDVPDFDNLRDREWFNANVEEHKALLNQFKARGFYTDQISDFEKIIEIAEEINTEWYSILDELLHEQLQEENARSMEESIYTALYNYELK